MTNHLRPSIRRTRPSRRHISRDEPASACKYRRREHKKEDIKKELQPSSVLYRSHGLSHSLSKSYMSRAALEFDICITPAMRWTPPLSMMQGFWDWQLQAEYYVKLKVTRINAAPPLSVSNSLQVGKVASRGARAESSDVMAPRPGRKSHMRNSDGDGESESQRHQSHTYAIY